MRITPAAHIRRMSGANDSLVYMARESQVFARSRGTRCRHFIQEQITAQEYMSEAARQWKALCPEQNSHWSDYAKVHFQTNDLGRPAFTNGICIFSKSAIV